MGEFPLFLSAWNEKEWAMGDCVQNLGRESLFKKHKKLISYTNYSYLCAVLFPKEGDDITRRRLLTLVFGTIERRKLNIPKSETMQRWMPRGEVCNYFPLVCRA